MDHDPGKLDHVLSPLKTLQCLPFPKEKKNSNSLPSPIDLTWTGHYKLTSYSPPLFILLYSHRESFGSNITLNIFLFHSLGNTDPFAYDASLLPPPNFG
jgi:hypothetical protein